MLHGIKRALILVPFLCLVFLLGKAVLAPVAESFGMYALSGYLYDSLSSICHQDPLRCLWIMERPTGLCVRCFFIYLFFALSLLIPLGKPVSRRVVIVALLLLPMVLDGGLQLVADYASGPVRRAVTGGLFGFASAAFYKWSVDAIIRKIQGAARAPGNRSGPAFGFRPIWFARFVNSVFPFPHDKLPNEQEAK